MSEELLSKKELLERTGISYGQLYRWKRKNLIPEEWFIRRSSFTGQETFFPKDKILTRVKRIQSLKDEVSLDDLADILSPNFPQIEITWENFAKRNIVTEQTLELWEGSPTLTLADMVGLCAADAALSAGGVSLAEAHTIIAVVRDHLEKFSGKPCALMFLRKWGVGQCLVISEDAQMYFDSEVHIVWRAPVLPFIEQLYSAISDSEEV